jgi:hypothetical protein
MASRIVITQVSGDTTFAIIGDIVTDDNEETYKGFYIEEGGKQCAYLEDSGATLNGLKGTAPSTRICSDADHYLTVIEKNSTDTDKLTGGTSGDYNIFHIYRQSGEAYSDYAGFLLKMGGQDAWIWKENSVPQRFKLAYENDLQNHILKSTVYNRVVGVEEGSFSQAKTQYSIVNHNSCVRYFLKRSAQSNASVIGRMYQKHVQNSPTQFGDEQHWYNSNARAPFNLTTQSPPLFFLDLAGQPPHTDPDDGHYAVDVEAT